MFSMNLVGVIIRMADKYVSHEPTPDNSHLMRISSRTMGQISKRAGMEARSPPGPFRLTDGERWYVVQTRPYSELRAQTQLEAQGFCTFLPLHLKTVRHARKLATVSAPFFPSYLFVVLDVGRDRWRCVNGTFGVVGLVMSEERPIPVARGAIESLAAARGADGHLQLGDGLAIGHPVRVLRGPFADLVGKLARIDRAGRVKVLLRLLGGDVPVSIAREALIPAWSA
jgi:transcription antitermination factor NusG